MKITAPAASAYEAERLITTGATELYCGLHPAVWEECFGRDVWLNRRGPGSANIPSLRELKRLVDISHGLDAQVFLTLNLPFYPSEQYGRIVQLVKQVREECGIDALIVADPGLILAIKEKAPETTIHVSSLSSVLNSASATFFRKLGVSRIIFPRYLGLAQIKSIVDRVGRDLEYEVFILNDGCVFEEGYCHVSHAFGGAFCHNPWWAYRLVGSGKERGQDPGFQDHLLDYQWWLWLGIKNCGGASSLKGQPLGMCGLCALPELVEMGITSLKIVGREAPLAKKEASVQLVNESLKLARGGKSAAVVKKMLKGLRDLPEYCTSGYMCYYR